MVRVGQRLLSLLGKSKDAFWKIVLVLSAEFSVFRMWFPGCVCHSIPPSFLIIPDFLHRIEIFCKQTSDPTCIDTSQFGFPYSNAPAMPQLPEPVPEIDGFSSGRDIPYFVLKIPVWRQSRSPSWRQSRAVRQ
jgi:hypothetical protein